MDPQTVPPDAPPYRAFPVPAQVLKTLPPTAPSVVGLRPGLVIRYFAMLAKPDALLATMDAMPMTKAWLEREVARHRNGTALTPEQIAETVAEYRRQLAEEGYDERVWLDDWRPEEGTNGHPPSGLLSDEPSLAAEPIPASPAQAEDTNSGNGSGTGAAPAPTPRRAPTRLMHPALDFDPEIGIFVGLLTETGEYRCFPENIRHVSKLKSFAGLLGRWPSADVEDFLANPTDPPPLFSDVLGLAIMAADQLIEFPRPVEHPALVGTWAVATYFHPIFLTFPRLLAKGERGSGKSKLLSFLSGITWNALYQLNPTPPVLFRLIQTYKPTLLLDEMETLNAENGETLRSIIHSGYKAGAAVTRIVGEDLHPASFDVYGPMALGGIKGAGAVTEDRCIPIVLQRGLSRDKVNTEVDPKRSGFPQLRSLCYRLLLTRWAEVEVQYRTMALPDWLTGRARELWKPLFTLAALADREGTQITPQLLTLAHGHVQERGTISAEGEALLDELSARLSPGKTEILVSPASLAGSLQTAMGWERTPTPVHMGHLLTRLGFPKTGRSNQGVRYVVRADYLAEVRERYELEV